MASTHLTALQVILPLVAGPLCVLFRDPRISWVLATTVSWVALIIAIHLLQQTLDHGEFSYALGGWAAPWGIEYRIDRTNAFVLVIVSAISAVVMPFARTSIERDIDRDRVYIFYAGWMLCLTGLLGIAATGDAFNVFVFLEISSLSSYLLISLARDRRALSASFQYLVLGTIGATFILIGIALVYMMTGTLNMSDLAARLPQVSGTRTVQAAFTFLVVGIGIKAAVFPLHLWLPNAYTYAPSAVTALLAGTATKVSFYLLLRFLFTVFGARFSFSEMHLDWLLLPMSLIAVFAMSTVAIYQSDVKRLLAYSSVAQIGYMVLGLSLVTVTGVTAAILHLFNHALMKVALFLSLGCVVYRIGGTSLDDFAGLGRRMPWTMAAFVAGGLSLIGIPLTVGFVSKWYLVLAALERDWWWLALAVLASSLVTAFYLWRVVEVAYFHESSPQRDGAAEAPWSLLVPTWLLIAANVYFGLDTSLTVGTAESAAYALLRERP